MFKFINESLNLNLLYIAFFIIKARQTDFDYQDTKNIFYLFKITQPDKAFEANSGFDNNILKMIFDFYNIYFKILEL